MIRPWPLALGTLTLAAVWAGPLPALAAERFSAHMTMHVAVVAIAAPLMAVGVAEAGRNLAERAPWLFAAIPASIVELAVVWAWHAPGLHRLARTTLAGAIAEQATFLAAALVVWVAAFCPGGTRGTARAGAGVVALLLTSMHMTLLGALLALAPRALYLHHAAGDARALEDQHLGGVIMLLVGGVSYLLGGLVLTTRLLRHSPALQPGERG